jgi:hypothetical protein
MLTVRRDGIDSMQGLEDMPFGLVRKRHRKSCFRSILAKNNSQRQCDFFGRIQSVLQCCERKGVALHSIYFTIALFSSLYHSGVFCSLKEKVFLFPQQGNGENKRHMPGLFAGAAGATLQGPEAEDGDVDGRGLHSRTVEGPSGEGGTSPSLVQEPDLRSKAKRRSAVTPPPLSEREEQKATCSAEAGSDQLPTMRRSRSLGPLQPARRAIGPPQQMHFGGVPVMFTAPHGLQVYRIGEGGKPRVHQRERFSTEIALRLSLTVGSMLEFRDSLSLPSEPAIPPSGRRNKPQQERALLCPTSFCVWSCMNAKPLDEDNLDPNYLFAKMFSSSPWHSSLRVFKHHSDSSASEECSGRSVDSSATLSIPSEHLHGAWWSPARHYPAGVVPLHVDLHGKINRVGNFDLDVGTASMDAFFSASGRILLLRDLLERELTTAMERCPVDLKGMPATVNMSPQLSGLWGVYEGAPHTMTTQAVLLGLHSVQLEIPFLMRSQLMSTTNPAFFLAFATAIAKVFVGLQSPEVQSRIFLRPVEQLPQAVIDFSGGSSGNRGSFADGNNTQRASPATCGPATSAFVSALKGGVGGSKVPSGPCTTPRLPTSAQCQREETPPPDAGAATLKLLRETIMFYQANEKKQI